MAASAVHRLAAAASSGEQYFLPPEKLLQGNPRQTVWLHYTDPSGQFTAGIWHSERGRWKILYTEQEYCRMLEGVSVITDAAGVPVTLRPGDECVIPAGFSGSWEVLEPTLKRFVIYEPGQPPAVTGPCTGDVRRPNLSPRLSSDCYDPAMRHPAPSLSEMPGMWRRSLIIHADGARDFTTQVRWLQAASLFVDLRQSAALPDFLPLRCLDDLRIEDCAQLAAQEGFAGRFGASGEYFEWQRWIDFQPRSLIADAGRLWWEDGMLIEAGRDVPYVEHWMRDPTVMTRPLAAMQLRELESGVAAQAVQVGTVFMFARDRRVALTAGRSLAACIAGAASLAEARAMLDCEISLGSAGTGAGISGDSGHLILASTHPWRVSERWQLRCADSTVHTVDIDPAGNPVARRWEVVDAEGDPGAVWPGR